MWEGLKWLLGGGKANRKLHMVHFLWIPVEGSLVLEAVARGRESLQTVET